MENLVGLKKVTSSDADFLTNLLNNKTLLKILHEKKSKLKDYREKRLKQLKELQ